MIHKITYKEDLIGASASFLCLIHCLATPFVFLVKSSAAVCCSDTPTWWQAMDYIFLVVAFFAVVHVTNNHRSKEWMKFSLVVSWLGLLLVTLNSTYFLFHITNQIAYIPAISLVCLHLYNSNIFSFLRQSK